MPEHPGPAVAGCSSATAIGEFADYNPKRAGGGPADGVSTGRRATNQMNGKLALLAALLPIAGVWLRMKFC